MSKKPKRHRCEEVNGCAICWVRVAPAPLGPPLGPLKNLPVPEEPPSRSLVRPRDLRVHSKGARVGMASSVFGFGTVTIDEPMIEIRARTETGTVEPVYLTGFVLACAVTMLHQLGDQQASQALKTLAEVDAASRETERKLKRIKRGR